VGAHPEITVSLIILLAQVTQQIKIQFLKPEGIASKEQTKA
jgi:hypothetical protein